MPRRWALAIALLASLALVAGACSSGSGSDATRDLTGNNLASNDLEAPGNPKPPSYGDNLSGELTIGYVTSSGGEGKDFQLLANGGRVIPSLVGNGSVKVEYADDQGGDVGAQTAVNSLISSGADVIVYGSLGPQLDAGIKAAAAKDVAVVLPYDADPALLANDNAFTIALDDAEVAQKLVDFGSDSRQYSRYAIINNADDPATASEKAAFVSQLAADRRTPVSELAVTEEPAEVLGEDDGATPEDEDASTTPTEETPSEPQQESLRSQLINVGAAQPDVLVVLGDADFVFNVAKEWHTTGLGAASMISPRAATPTLGTLDINALSPPLRSPLSTGLAGGPWIQTVPIVNYFAKRNALKTTSDMSVADVISADAGLIAIAAAEDAKSTQPAKIKAAFDGLTVKGIGADYDFAGQSGAGLDDYAITAYNREESSANTFVGKQFPDVRSAGGFFVALQGTAPLLENTNPFEG